MATPIKPHWPNPWIDRIVFVPVERLAEAIAGGKAEINSTLVNYTPSMVLDHWRTLGENLDAYIFREKDSAGYRSCGLRYGSDGGDYLSLHPRQPEVLERVLAEALVQADAER